MIQTNPEQSLELYCPECDTQIYRCDECDSYFDPSSIMYCDEKAINGYHICESCMDFMENRK